MAAGVERKIYVLRPIGSTIKSKEREIDFTESDLPFVVGRFEFGHPAVEAVADDDQYAESDR